MNRGAKILSALLSERGAQKRLAGELGIDQGYLSKIASGERIPGLDARRRLKPLGIDLEAWDEELLDLAPEPTAHESGPHPAVTGETPTGTGT